MIEIKCPFWRRRDHPKGWRLHSSIPPSYYLQINTLLEVCDRQWCDRWWCDRWWCNGW